LECYIPDTGARCSSYEQHFALGKCVETYDGVLGLKLGIHGVQKDASRVAPFSPGCLPINFAAPMQAHARKVATLQVSRAAEFAPVKNGKGVDSPHTARALVAKAARAQLRAALLPLGGGGTSDDVVNLDRMIDSVVEISPLLSYNGEGLRSSQAHVRTVAGDGVARTAEGDGVARTAEDVPGDEGSIELLPAFGFGRALTYVVAANFCSRNDGGIYMQSITHRTIPSGGFQPQSVANRTRISLICCGGATQVELQSERCAGGA
jgi:hypothetical protein